MKKINYLICTILLLASCKNSQYAGENKIWNCLTTYANYGEIDLQKELEIHENFLVNNGVLESANGAGYIQYLEHLIATNSIIAPPTDKRWLNTLQQIGNIEGDVMDCQPELNKHKIAIVRKVQRTQEMLESVKNISPEYVGKMFLTTFTETDLEQPLYRFFFFELISSFIEPDNGIPRHLALPPKPE